MIRFNFINQFQELAHDYSKKNNIKIEKFTNKDFSILNNQLFKILKEDFKKEIPYLHIKHSDDLGRDVILYIPNKDLHERTFKKHGSNHRYTTDFKTFVKQEDIPLDNYLLEIDCGRVEDLTSTVKSKYKSTNKIESKTGALLLSELSPEHESEALKKLVDLDGFSYLNPQGKGIYFFTKDDKGLTSIIMLEENKGLFLLHYVNTANRSRGQGLGLKVYEAAMEYVVKNNGIFVRSEPSELGAAFIEKKITKMLENKFPFEPVLSERTKDLHTHIRLILSEELSPTQQAKLKSTIQTIVNERSYLPEIKVMGEFTGFEITPEMTERDKNKLTLSIKSEIKPTRTNKSKP